MILVQRMSTMEPHRSHLSHKKTILMQEMTADADSHHSHKNRQEAEELMEKRRKEEKKRC